MKRVSQYQKLANKYEKLIEKSANHQISISALNKDMLEFLKNCTSNTDIRAIVRRIFDCTKYSRVYRTEFHRDAKVVKVFLVDVNNEEETHDITEEVKTDIVQDIKESS